MTQPTEPFDEPVHQPAAEPVDTPADAIADTATPALRDALVARDGQQLRALAQPLAAQGHVYAMFCLGMMYLWEEEEDIPRAIFWLGQAAGRGDGYALRILKQIRDVPDRPRVIACMEQAADWGCCAVMLLLSDMFMHDSAGMQDMPRAIAWLERAVALGDIKAIHKLSYIYCGECDSSWQDIPRAIAWLERAAKEGDASSMRRLGQLYMQDDDRRDGERAAHWLEQAVELGDRAALFRLADLYLQDGEWNMERALACLERIAEMGYVDAMNKLGKLYAKMRDTSRAIAWLERAVERGGKQAKGAYAG